MWDRKELKERAKDFLRGNYGNSLVIVILLGFINSYKGNPMFRFFGQIFIDMSHSRGFTIFLIAVLSLLFTIFIANPMLYGGDSFFLRGASCGKSNVSDFLNAFREGSYGNIVKTMLIRNIFFLLWMIPFFLPYLLIIFTDMSEDFFMGLLLLSALIGFPIMMFKSYQYRFIPFILDDYPEMPSLEIIKRSKELTKGHKFAMFVLDLSFMGWYILGLLLLFIGVIFVQPYHQSTIAFLYLELEEIEEW